MPRFVEVLIDSIPLADPKPYTYRVPPELEDEVALGSAVAVPFGGRRKVGGFVVACHDQEPQAPLSQAPLKEILGVLGDMAVPPALYDLFDWVAETSMASFAQVWTTAVPRGSLARKSQAKTQWMVRLVARPEGLTKRQQQVLAVLEEAGGLLSLSEFAKRAGTSAGVIRALAGRQAVTLERDRIWRAPVLPEAQHAVPFALNAAQRTAVEAIARGKPGDAFLLYGVTGSGKTEVYLQAIAKTLSEGKSAIMLVPEIALTPQTVARFRGRFGDRLALMHSTLGDGERFDEWERLRDGSACVAIGARSAVFAPLAHLGLVILDEEHEGSYKQDSAPRYHAREVALARARFEGAKVILGSATPSVETYHRASTGEITRLDLPGRVSGRALPPVELVDMREELQSGNRKIFSRALQDALREHLDRGEQTILLMNRRGYASFVLCRDCGGAVRCPSCSVSLTYHRDHERLRCHLCDFSTPYPKRCQACGSPRIKHFGAGTQQVAEAAAELLPEARILRLDRDTTTRKDSHRRILEAFARGEANVLIGTQMVAKGLDLPRVTLVGVVAADVALNLPDFRAAERTFQLITQVAGRAGRAELPGRVIVQTYAPDHPSLIFARTHDYTGFYAREVADREALRYPPFQRLVNVVFSAETPQAAWAAAETAAGTLRENLALTVLGPAEPAISQLRGRYRVQVLLKCPDPSEARASLRAALQPGSFSRGAGLRVAVDVDPGSLL
jgi:primosomal protein N' (replication factor Y)